MIPPARFVPIRARARPRGAFTLIELLVVIAIVGVLLALLLPAVQKVREAAARMKCQSNLKQLGLALHSFHDVNGYLPPGMATEGNSQDAFHTGFTYLLPYLEQGNLYNTYHMDKQWYDPENYKATEQQIPIFFCPSNRVSGTIDLTPYNEQWGGSQSLPPYIGACDYVLCKGANPFFFVDPPASTVAPQLTGLFNEVQYGFIFDPTGRSPWVGVPKQVVRFTDITDGLSSTIAIGEAAGGNPTYLVADINNPSQPATEPYLNGPVPMDQAWAAASMGDYSHPWYASIFGVTANLNGSASNWTVVDEPMNRRPGTPTFIGRAFTTGSSNDSTTTLDHVSGFRSMHLSGCNFLFADGSVHFIPQTIDPTTYRALSTYAGNEVISATDF